MIPLWTIPLLCSIARAEERGDLFARLADSVLRVKVVGGSGTGFLVRDSATVATALHVVSENTAIVVETRDGDLINARVHDFDPDADIAILSLERPLKALPFALASAPPRVGDTAYAIGNPLLIGSEPTGEMEGLLGWSFTEGMVGAVGTEMLQLSTSLQPGNSGGPVFNQDGEVVGVAVQRRGDFGFATHVVALLTLLENGEPRSFGPDIKLSVEMGFHVEGLPGELKGRRGQLGMRASTLLSIKRRWVVGVGAGGSWLVNREEVPPARRFDLFARGGPSLDLPARPTGGAFAQVRPYALGGITIAEAGERVSTLRFADPECDPGTAACATEQSDDTDWTRRFAPLVGVGTQFSLFYFWFGLETALAPTDPSSPWVAGQLGMRL